MYATEEIARLIKRYIEGKITDEETLALQQWRQQEKRNESFFQRIVQDEKVFEDALTWAALHKDDKEDWLQSIKDQTFHKIHQSTLRPHARRSYFIYTAFAAIFLAVCFLGYFALQDPVAQEEQLTLASIQPGNNTAELTLSNGEKISLRGDKEGIVLNDGMTYADGSPIISIDHAKLSQITATIHVPRGGKYKVTLADGTNVWLNAQSKLVYPLAFQKQRRKVTLEGEAYFEVAKLTNQNQPVSFEVYSKNQKIIVTGTAFNLSAYTDDKQAITTLIEGSVTVETGGHRLDLEPNEQTVNIGGELLKKQVDIHSFIAWKDDKFVFYETELQDLMKQIGRWYAIDINYPKQLSPTYFYGEIGRDKNLAEVLRIIEKSGVKFDLSKRGGTPLLTVIQ